MAISASPPIDASPAEDACGEAIARFRAVQAGDRDALDALVNAEAGWVRAVVWSLLRCPDATDDVTQQVWLSVVRSARQCQEPARWRAWLYRLCRNAVTDWLRSRRRQRRLLGEWNESSLDGAIDRRDPAAEDDTHEAVLRAVRHLPPPYRMPLILRAMHGWSQADIARVLGLPVATVETRLVRARRQLRETMADRSSTTIDHERTTASATDAPTTATLAG